MKKILLSFLIATSMIGCSGLLYHPTKTVYVESQKLKIKPQDSFIAVANGRIHLHSWYFQSPSKQKRKDILLVQFHGNAQNLSSHFYSLYWLVHQGFDLLSFDYRGYGKSEGHSSPEVTVKDGVEVLRYVIQKFPRKKIVVYGQSLGAAIAARALIEMNPGKNEIAGLILEGSFSSYEKVAAQILARSAWTWIFQPFAYLALSDEFAPENHWNKLNPEISVLVIHGDQDPIISLQLGEDVFRKIPGPKKEFMKIEGGKHLDLYLDKGRETYQKRLSTWLRKKTLMR